jgi:hypothetical protein
VSSCNGRIRYPQIFSCSRNCFLSTHHARSLSSPALPVLDITEEPPKIGTPTLFIHILRSLNSGCLSGRWQFRGIVEFDHWEQVKILGFQHLREF